MARGGFAKAGALAIVAALCAFGTGAMAQALQAVPPGARPPVAAPAAPVAGAATAPAHVPVITKAETERKGRADRDVFLGVYLTLDRECKVGEAPKIEFTVPPRNGKMRTRTYAINLRDVPGAPRRNCIGISPSGVAVVYRANRRFSGEEQVSFAVIYPNGDRREISAKVLIQ